MLIVEVLPDFRIVVIVGMIFARGCGWLAWIDG